MKIILEKRKDSYLFVYKRFTYNMDKRYTYIYRCSTRRTSACKGILILIKENESFILEYSHNHSSEPYASEVLNLKSEIIQICKKIILTKYLKKYLILFLEKIQQQQLIFHIIR